MIPIAQNAIKNNKPRIALLLFMCYNIEKSWSVFMDIANRIKELRESIGMNRREFSEYTGIPIRTLEDWEAGRRTPPEYVPRLLAYMLKYEELIARKEGRDEKDGDK